MRSATAVIRVLAIGMILVGPSKLVQGAPDDDGSFGSDQDFQNYLKKKKKPRPPRRATMEFDEAAPAEPAPAPAAEPAAPSAPAAGSESITNNQHAGVDEGGIVKTYGDFLVILRRGRLFSVRVGQSDLLPTSAVDAFGPDVDPAGTWYDEMLVSDGTIAVIGYSYARGGTEVGLFDIDGAGRIRYRATYDLRSNDYYSSRNYASRLIDHKLIFYSPLYFSPYDDTQAFMPAVRRWHRGARPQDFKPILAPSQIYRPLWDEEYMALHTITICDLGHGEMQCKARAIMGPAGRVFYVSKKAVYVWATSWTKGQRSLLYRLPLDGSAPQTLRVHGAPTDQFSFLEGEDGYLNVLLRSDGAGDWMWLAEKNLAGEVALLRFPLALFAHRNMEVPANDYVKLTRPDGYTFNNRFVGDAVLYGTGSGWGMPTPGNKQLYVYRYASGGRPMQLGLSSGSDRIEAMGKDAMVVGSDGQNLQFTAIALQNGARIGGRYTQKAASQGELRSHGFFYKPDGDQTGIFGLPVRSNHQPGYAHLIKDSASILFVRNDHLALESLGALQGSFSSENDSCRASCVDWYGNARPIFLRGRIFALLGYELIEGSLGAHHIGEARRVNFAPQPVVSR